MSSAPPTKGRPVAGPPSFREMLKITISLALVCLISALILGGVYYFTEPAKERNLREREVTTIRTLLEVPEGGKVDEVRRYMNDKLWSVYLTPKFLVAFDEEGKEFSREPKPGTVSARDAEAADTWVREKTGGRYVGRFFIARQGDQNLGYVVEGSTVGYKSGIRFFVALASDLTMKGVEILAQEEDPGLGGEISQPYFKNQFVGRADQDIDRIAVTRDPLPSEWRAALEMFGPQPYSTWIQKHRDELVRHPVIHAITGSTISSDAVTRGVKRTLGSFRQRLKRLEGAI